MDKVYDHSLVEEKIYKKWEEGGYFKPEINPDGKPYSIILPPPNANGDLHFGHAMMTIEDILIRFKRMQGFSTLWLPGTDHAGTETQFVYEKRLQEKGKSRFDYNRKDLFDHIWEYVQANRGGIETQLKRLGFSLDWSRAKFTLDSDVVEEVIKTFRKMYADGLVYRDYRLVNYCTKDGTAFSDLEAISEEKEGKLYFITYPIKPSSAKATEGKTGGSITVATTRPETMFGDVAVMVNPEDPRYKDVIGKTVLLPLTNREIPIIADSYVEKDFGTGAVKVTPSHDFNDFEVGRRHNLTFPPIIGWSGKFEKTGVVDGLYAKQARALTIEKLQEQGLLEKEEPHTMVIKICYKCKTVLEPLPLEQWYIKVAPLVETAMKALDTGVIKVFPENYMHNLELWYKNLRDWNISRQNVWGIQIPVWYEVERENDFAVSFIDATGAYHQGLLDDMLSQGFAFEEITSGLQRVIARMESKVVFEEEKVSGTRYLPETDTFDTWFSSGQWPYVTLKTSKPGDFEKFYPTSVMETGRDILHAWISRMIMLGVYIGNGQGHTDVASTVPFKDVVLHGMVLDPLGKKMSKSKGNVVNPLSVADQYGADAVRFALVYGTALGNDQAMSYPKLDSARKFTNKLWNMARFIEFKQTQDESLKLDVISSFDELATKAVHETDKAWIEETKAFTSEVTNYLEKYQFNLAAERIYDFAWHEFADVYIEDVKNRMDQSSFTVTVSLYVTILKVLHPFMPFVTEEIYSLLTKAEKPLIIEAWPQK